MQMTFETNSNRSQARELETRARKNQIARQDKHKDTCDLFNEVWFQRTYSH
jgi:hypothetical protein